MCLGNGVSDSGRSAVRPQCGAILWNVPAIGKVGLEGAEASVLIAPDELEIEKGRFVWRQLHVEYGA